MNGPVSVAMTCEALVVLIIFIGAAIYVNADAIITALQNWGGA